MSKSTFIAVSTFGNLTIADRLAAGGVAADFAGIATPCRSNDADLWFAERAADIELAKALCQTCPLMAQCLAGAMEREEPWGVWGGEYLAEGKIVARKRGRGRPPRAPAALAS